jgi:hypothetical protein
MDFMSTIFPDRLRIGDMMYSIDSHPLEPFLDALPRRPEKRSTMNTLFGYIATWESFEGRLYLVDINSEPHLKLFAKVTEPIVASWFSGIVCAWRGESRESGYPPRKFWNEQIVLDIVNGEVVREWVLDLRSLPNQTGAELEQSLPAFLMKPK